MAQPSEDQAKLFGLAFGFAAVTLLQVYAFNESWARALFFAALITAGALVVELVRRRRR